MTPQDFTDIENEEVYEYIEMYKGFEITYLVWNTRIRDYWSLCVDFDAQDGSNSGELCESGLLSSAEEGFELANTIAQALVSGEYDDVLYGE